MVWLFVYAWSVCPKFQGRKTGSAASIMNKPWRNFRAKVYHLTLIDTPYANTAKYGTGVAHLALAV